MAKYDAIIQDQLKRGFIEKVEVTSNPGGRTHYLAHHPVIKSDSSTTKVRIVFDGSAKLTQKSLSLNDCLFEGPNMIGDLFNILLRFWLRLIAMTSDIEKAFLMVGLKEKDRDCTRFYWLDDYTKGPNATVVTYRFQRVPFGIVSNPFLLMATIRHHLTLNETAMSVLVKDNLYMDNCVVSVDSEQIAHEFYMEAKGSLKNAGMNLREWSTNSTTLNEMIPEIDQCKDKSVKVLGLHWNPEMDLLQFKQIEAEKTIPTKRNALHTVSLIFDPLGLVSPVTIMGKMFMQMLWEANVGWDSLIPQALYQSWNDICSEIRQLNSIVIPRYLGFSNGSQFELHVFGDASAKAYAAVAYVKFLDSSEYYHTKLICSKTRVSPVKNKLSLPWLELMSALIAVRLALRVTAAMKSVAFARKVIWSDSIVALDWIYFKNQLPQFVKNRVEEIRKYTSFAFKCVPSKENPADLPTRGKTVEFLKESELWWCGPTWLKGHEDNWPCQAKVHTTGHTLVSYQNDVSEELETSEKNSTEFMKLENFNSLKKLLRVTAFCMRFIDKLRKGKNDGPLTSEEISKAQDFWNRRVQSESFGMEINMIKQAKFSGLVKQLNLFQDETGLIRCRGRIDNAPLSDQAKHPKLLPKNNHYTKLLVLDLHERLCHAGVRHTTTALRLEYWLPQARQQISKIISKCFVCLRWEGKCYGTPLPPPLPKQRVQSMSAFEVSGVDYAGPIYIKEGKSWICFITCTVTRAIHLELVPDMTTRQFLLAFRRFISRRGIPAHIYSDNAKTFKLAKGTLDYLWNSLITSSDVLDYISTKGIKWVFNVERAPWWGGFFERLVGLVKRALIKAVGKAQLSYVELETELIEIEAVINSRPLTFVYHNIRDGNPLTANDQLAKKGPTGFPQSSTDVKDITFGKEESSESLSRRMLHTQKVLNNFWKIWRQEYLTQLREQHLPSNLLGKTVYRSPMVGEVVLVKEDLPRAQWKLGIITKVYVDNDGFIRAAEVRCGTSIYNRPIQLLYPLEVKSSHNEIGTMYENLITDAPNRPKRAAAVEANLKLKAMANLPPPEDV